MQEKISVLDDIGFVRFVEAMASDLRVVEAARISTNQGTKGEEADEKLIRFLLKNEHGTPFEHAVFKFHIKLPIFVMREWIRHRTSSYNEMSARYTQLLPEFYVPTKWRKQATTNKQSSEATEELDHRKWHASYLYQAQRDYLLYEEALRSGVARELARMTLPVNIYTQFFWTVNSRALMNFIKLRSAKNAQWEIQQYSNALFCSFFELMPWTATAFVESLPLNDYDVIRRIALK